MAWPSSAGAAITLTFDNMGEAADINRNLWPSSEPIGSHYSVTTILPKFLTLTRKHNLPATYFAEASNFSIYPQAFRDIANAGHEVAFHAWQHENWAKECEDPAAERANFERSFEAMGEFVAGETGNGGEDVEGWMYQGFRPPGGMIHGERTMRLCREFGVGYISPAAESAALILLRGEKTKEEDSMVILPFRWRGVDAYYYMDSFSKLREVKRELPSEPQSPSVLVAAFTKLINEAIEKGEFLSLLFHPFLTDTEERLEAMEQIMRYLVEKRQEGAVWVASARDIEAQVRQHPDVVGRDPGWDNTSWR